MARFHWVFSLVVLLTFNTAWAASDEDSSITTIHNIDLTKDSGPQGPNYSLIIFNVKKVNVPGSRAHVIFRQFAKRVRLEIEAAGIPKGKYHVGVSARCSPSEGAWTRLHEVEQTSTYLASEKSLPDFALREAPVKGQKVLTGLNVGLFQVKGKKSTLVDCKPIK